MALFKKKKDIPALHVLLDGEKSCHPSSSFYYPLFDNEIETAQRWCKKNGYSMELDYIRDGDIFYKFNPNT